MAPASTNGDRLFGSPMTSAGTPSDQRVERHGRIDGDDGARPPRSSGASGAAAGSTRDVLAGRAADLVERPAFRRDGS